MIVRSTGHSVLHFLWREKVHHFSSLDAALQFLAPFKDNPGQMAELRRLLMEENGPVDLTRATNDQLIRATAGMLVGRELLVGIEWKGRLPAVAGDEEAPPAPAAAAPPAPRQEEDAPTFGGSHDAGAQAGALSEAAAGGVPFCEECARLARGES